MKEDESNSTTDNVNGVPYELRTYRESYTDYEHSGLLCGLRDFRPRYIV
jgi:hypothetical protein